MKRPPLRLAATLLAALPLFAQDKTPALRATPAETPRAPAETPRAPAEAEGDRLELMPSKPAQLLPPPASLPLIPDLPMPAPVPRGSSPESPIKKRDSATANAEEAVRQRIRLREAKTKAQRDPAVQAEWDRAAASKTDAEKREVLRSYYRLLYGRMAKIDLSLKTPIDLLLKESLGRLEQTRVAPSQTASTVATGPRAAR